MKEWPKKILPNFRSSSKIEVGLFELSLLLTCTVFLFWLIYGFSAGYNITIQCVYFFGFVFYCVLFVLQKKGYSFRILSHLYYYFGLLLLTGAWLPSGGMVGAVTTFLFLLYLSGLLVLSPKDYLIYVSASMAIVITYAILELQMNDLAAPYMDKQSLLRDLSIANIIVFLLAGLTVFIFKNSHLKDRIKLEQSNAQLSLAMKKAESADQAKTNFLATISHEMRTPLNGIMGMIDFLSKTEINQEQQELLGNLNYSTKILHELISDVLDITAIEAGKLALNYSSVDLYAELTELWKIFESKIQSQGKNLNIQFEYDKAIPKYLSLDLNRLRQILINLINNSIKFTNAGEIVFSVNYVGQALNDQASLKFVVRDTGIGISKDRQDQLFNRFYKASDDYSIEGTGLGLSIVKNLVELMGGEIGFRSEYGKGTTFTFSLSFEIAEEPLVQRNIDNAFCASLSDLQVLVAEDVKINQIVASKMLTRLGVKHIELVNNGAEAIAVCIRKHFDIILMDLQMPEVAGIEATKAILANNPWDKVPVIIALTANAMKQDLDECLAVGMSDFIVKPFNDDSLKGVLLKYI